MESCDVHSSPSLLEDADLVRLQTSLSSTRHFPKQQHKSFGPLRHFCTSECRFTIEPETAQEQLTIMYAMKQRRHFSNSLWLQTLRGLDAPAGSPHRRCSDVAWRSDTCPQRCTLLETKKLAAYSDKKKSWFEPKSKMFLITLWVVTFSKVLVLQICTIWC